MKLSSSLMSRKQHKCDALVHHNLLHNLKLIFAAEMEPARSGSPKKKKMKPFVWYSSTGPNYVKCKAAFYDRSTKGLQGPHYTLRLSCKLGNKESVSCYSETTPLPSVPKNSLFPGFCCQRGSLLTGWMFGVH